MGIEAKTAGANPFGDIIDITARSGFDIRLPINNRITGTRNKMISNTSNRFKTREK
jgi:hypothetical protein